MKHVFRFWVSSIRHQKSGTKKDGLRNRRFRQWEFRLAFGFSLPPSLTIRVTPCAASLERAAVCSLPLLLRVSFLAMALLRREVLGGYRRLMRVRVVAFKDDTTMLEASKQQLRIEFNKNKAVTDPSKIGQQHSRAKRRLTVSLPDGKCLTISNRGSVTSCACNFALSNAICFLCGLCCVRPPRQEGCGKSALSVYMCITAAGAVLLYGPAVAHGLSMRLLASCFHALHQPLVVISLQLLLGTK